MKTALQKLLAALACSSTTADWATFPVKSINLAQSWKPTLYVAPVLESDGLFDVHPTHGLLLSDGSIAYTGKTFEVEETEGTNYNSAFVAKLTPTGTVTWVHKGTLNGKHDLSNAVVQLPNGGDLVYAGYADNGAGVYQRALTKIALSTGSVIWGPKLWASATAAKHGAWEFAQLSDDGTKVLLAGVYETVGTAEFNFKSFGNVADGNAIVQMLPVSALGATAPEAAAVDWTYVNPTYKTAKKAAPLPDGGCIVGLLGDEGADTAVAVRLSSSGTVVVRVVEPRTGYRPCLPRTSFASPAVPKAPQSSGEDAGGPARALSRAGHTCSVLRSGAPPSTACSKAS